MEHTLFEKGALFGDNQKTSLAALRPQGMRGHKTKGRVGTAHGEVMAGRAPRLSSGRTTTFVIWALSIQRCSTTNIVL